MKNATYTCKMNVFVLTRIGLLRISFQLNLAPLETRVHLNSQKIPLCEKPEERSHLNLSRLGISELFQREATVVLRVVCYIQNI